MITVEGKTLNEAVEKALAVAKGQVESRPSDGIIRTKFSYGGRTGEINLTLEAIEDTVQYYEEDCQVAALVDMIKPMLDSELHDSLGSVG